MKINFITDDEYLNHDTGISHPENISRYKAVSDLLNTNYSNHNFIKPRLSTVEEIGLVHNHEYVDSILNGIPKSGYTFFDPDTIACPKSLKSYLLAAGSGLTAIDDILMNKKKRSAYFCCLRPPGHHVEINKAMGFGVFNNIAIAASYANLNKNLSNILIIDFDVHHGNGTQHIFENSSNIKYGSSHQYPFYPGSGSIEETGNGNIFNCPLPANTNSDDFKLLFRDNILNKIQGSFDLIFFSAGFDAHKNDPLASINLSSEDFYWITDEVLKKFANNIPIISILEGGYDMIGLRDGLDNHLKALYKYINNE